MNVWNVVQGFLSRMTRGLKIQISLPTFSGKKVKPVDEEQLALFKGFKASEPPKFGTETPKIVAISAFPIEIKPSVIFKVLKPEIYSILSIISEVYHSVGRTAVITSANDGVHKGYGLFTAGEKDPKLISKHYLDLAIDLRTKHLLDNKQKHLVFEMLKNRLGHDYLVLFENEGEGQEHLHLQSQSWLKAIQFG